MFIAESLSASELAEIARVREAWLHAINSDDVDGQIARAIWNSDTPLSAPAPSADVRAIERVAADYAAACNAGDLDGFMATCTAGIVFLPPEADAVVGAEAVRGYIKTSFLDPFDVHLSFSFDALTAAGASAFGHGPYELKLTP